MACDRVSAEVETEEGDKVKEDEEVEFDVVEGTVRVQQSCDAVQRIARHVDQTSEETDRKKTKKKKLCGVNENAERMKKIADRT